MITALAMAGLSAFSSIQGSKKQNKQLEQQAKEVKRKFLIKRNISEEQLDDLGELLFAQMTSTTRTFLKNKSRLRVAQAESGVAGKSVDRLFLDADMKEAEAKSLLVEQTEKSAINIANASLADAVQADGMMKKIEAQAISGTEAVLKAIGAGAQGFAMGSQLSAGFSTPTNTVASTVTTAPVGSIVSDPRLGINLPTGTNIPVGQL